MKKVNMFKVLFAGLVLSAILTACKKDESFSQVTAFERGIHNAINDHRVSVSKPEMVLQFLMVNDAQSASARLANGTVSGIGQLAAELSELETNLGGDASSIWTAECRYENVDSVMNIILSNADVKAIIEGNYNQSAVGAVKDSEGIFHVTHLLLHIP